MAFPRRFLPTRLGAALLGAHIAGLVAFAALAVAGIADHAGSRVLYAMLIIAPAVAVVIRGLTGQRADRGWLWIGAGLCMWAAGDQVYMVLLDRGAVPAPSIADAMYWAMYPLVAVGGVKLLRDRGVRLDRYVVADATIAGLGVAALLAGVALHEVADATAVLPISDQLTMMTYPALDLLLVVGAVVALVAINRQLDRAWLAVTAGAIVWAVCDTVWARQAALGTYATGDLLTVGWPLAFALVSAGAWSPRSHAPRERNHGPAVGLAVGGAAVVLLVLDHFVRMDAVAVVLAGMTLVAALVRVKMSGDNERRALAVASERALIDTVTGLPNRRALMNDLELALPAADEHRRFALGFFDLDGFKGYNDTFGHPAGDALLARLGQRLKETVAPGLAYRMGGDEYCVLVPLQGPMEEVQAAADAALREEGEAFCVKASGGWATLPDDGRVASDVLRAADRRMYQAKGAGRVSDIDQTRQLLKSVIHESDPELGKHDGEVAQLAHAVAVELGLDEQGRHAARLLAELHDIGKLAIPDAILRKAGPLDAAEQQFILQHTIVGQRICASVPSLAHIATLVRSTHERWDGDGYPDGLAGDQIPLPAQIVFCCDAYDAMTSDRPYRAPITKDAALAELRACAGSQFSPRVVDAFCAISQRQREAAAIPATASS